MADSRENELVDTSTVSTFIEVQSANSDCRAAFRSKENEIRDSVLTGTECLSEFWCWTAHHGYLY